MSNHILTGQKGEEIAFNYLLTKGHGCLERNWRFRRAEVDIISTKDGILIFTEVKTRNAGKHIDPSASVDHKKERGMKAVAAQFMEENEYEWAFRFDIITIILHDQDYELKHYKDVFY